MAVIVSDIIDFTGSDNEFNLYPQMDKRYGPYNSVSAALSALTSSKRCIGLTIGIKSGNSIAEYWFKDGVQDSNLVEKAGDAYQNYKSNGGTKTRSEFYTSLKEIIDTSAYVVLHSNNNNVKVEVTVSKGEPAEIGSSFIEPPVGTTSSTSSESSVQLAYLQLDTKDLNINLPEESRTINVNISNGGGENSYILDGSTIKKSYSGIGGTKNCKISLTLPLSTYEQVIGFYDSKTGELLSNEQSYTFNTPSNGVSYITIKFKNSN